MLYVDGISCDRTTTGCLSIPLKSGNPFPISWTRFSGLTVGETALYDGWTPGGYGGMFSFLPLVNLYQVGVGPRRRISDRGQVVYSAADVPENAISYSAITTSTYWTEYDQLGQTYYEYFAGSSLSSSDKMYGRLNRRFDLLGNELFYHYTDNAGGKPLLRKISGFGGNLVPYFEYSDETIDSTHLASITKIFIADGADLSQSRTVYFEYVPNSYYLNKVVQPEGCVSQFYPNVPVDAFNTYRIGLEQDAEGYTTYFTYASNTLTGMIEPEGRRAYYSYVSNLTSRADLNRPARKYAYNTNAAGTMTFVTRDQDAAGNTLYYEYDSAVPRAKRTVDRNGNVTTFGQVANSQQNSYAMAARISTFNGASAYYDYSGQTYNLSKVLSPRHVPGSFPVVTYYEYDSQRQLTKLVKPLGGTFLLGRDQQGRITRGVDARGYKTYFNYGSQTGFIDSIVDAEGGVAYFGYNSFGDAVRSVSRRWKNEGGFASFTTYYAYDKRSRLLRSIDPTGAVTYFDWTGRGDLLASTDAVGTEILNTYNGLRLNTQRTVTDQADKELTRETHGYDIYKNRVRSLDARGNATYYFYDVLDRLTSTVSPISKVVYYHYDALGKVTHTVNPLGKTTYFFYDQLSRKTGSKDALGSSTYFIYDLAGNRTHEIDPLGFVTYYFFDALDRPDRTRDALGNERRRFYDGLGNITETIDERGNAGYFFYNGLGRSKAQRDALGNWTYFAYDGSDNRTQEVDALGHSTLTSHDALNRISRSRDAAGISTYYFYDGVGNNTKVIDGRGNASYFVYDGLRRRTSTSDLVGRLSVFDYDTVGNLVARFEQSGLVAGGYGSQPYGTSGYGGSAGKSQQLVYDALNRIQAAVDSLGNTAYYVYDTVGNLAKFIDARGNGSYFFYDAVDRLTVVRDPLGNAAYYFYDQKGNRTAIRDPRGFTSYYSYDALNRLTEHLEPTPNNLIQHQYDAAGNLTAVRMKGSGTTAGYGIQSYGTTMYGSFRTTVTYFNYDELNRIVARRDAFGNLTYFGYDAVGNRNKELDPRGNPTYYMFDGVHRTSQIRDALGRAVYYEYDGASNLGKYVNAEGSSTTNTYDAANRQTAVAFAPAGSDISSSLRSNPYYVYDQIGNVTQIGDLWGLHLMGYDSNARLTTHQYPNGSKVYFEYDGVANITATVYPGSSGRSTAAYDAANRQIRVQSPSGATAYFAYDSASNLTQRFLGNGVKQDSTYDAIGHISSWRNADKNGAPLSYFDYLSVPNGSIVRTVREAIHTVYYEYDLENQLVSEVWATTGASPGEIYGYRYSYDSAGNRTRARVNGVDTYYFYDQANELVVTGTNAQYAGPTYFIYDRNGSLINMVEPSGATYFAYNGAGLVARIRWKDASATYFFYNGSFQRYGMNAHGTVTYFLWDGPSILQELHADGTVKEENTNASTLLKGIGQLVESNRPGQAQAKLYPIMDPRGSVCKWLQSDGTTVFASREYDAFGNVIPNSAVGTWPGRFGYQGQTWMEILSSNGNQRLLLSPARLYDPALGIFLQSDPIRRGNPLLLDIIERIFERRNGALWNVPTATVRKNNRNLTTCHNSQQEVSHISGQSLPIRQSNLYGNRTRSKTTERAQPGENRERTCSCNRVSKCIGCADTVRADGGEYTYAKNEPQVGVLDPTGLAIRSIDTPQALEALAYAALYGSAIVVTTGGGIIAGELLNKNCPIDKASDFIMATIGVSAIIDSVKWKCILSGKYNVPGWDFEGAHTVCVYQCGPFEIKVEVPYLDKCYAMELEIPSKWS